MTEPAAGYVGRIPVRNLWLLMLYASDLFKVHGHGLFDLEAMPDAVPDLIAEILALAVEQRLHRQLSTGYTARDAVLSRVRGRIDVLKTERHQLLQRGVIACRFEELTVDTPRNRLVLGALERIAALLKSAGLAHRCRALAGAMKRMGVSGVTPARSTFSTQRFGRHDAEDRVMVAAAKLAFDLALPCESAGATAAFRSDRDEVWVRRLFEHAVAGYYQFALRDKGWRVSPGRPLGWALTRKSAGIDKIFPSMRTDVVLEHAATSRRIVIDTKFNAIVTEGWYRMESLRSGYIYQLYAYLRTQAGLGDPVADRAEGMLLHPSVGVQIDEAVEIQGHAMRFVTVDLSGPSIELGRQLIGLCEPFRFAGPEGQS
ncbi:5-methylcytosine-specific restriction endonuclease system specificity protein McrC [Roseateles toxinivorans]|uniref:5-methylcytosine-specific restriction endonuclease system specificity protein McrC n=1 Tax=Roseateles toxinivorans TaxID=270368 RepID=UPI001FB655A4|nr:5-methylcytosine-specific restriction endonuclease system specificity protein McrC [Roseateles toxinivorans]